MTDPSRKAAQGLTTMQQDEPPTASPTHVMLGAAEQRGDGVRELHDRLKVAVTRAEFETIADEAERRRARPGLQPPVETAYGVLSSLAQKRAAAIGGAFDELERRVQDASNT